MLTTCNKIFNLDRKQLETRQIEWIAVEDWAGGFALLNLSCLLDETGNAQFGRSIASLHLDADFLHQSTKSQTRRTGFLS